MIRDMSMAVGEMLFWFTDGVLLMNTLWIFVWVALGAVIMCIPFWIAITKGQNRTTSFPSLVFLFSFFPLLLLIMGPPIVQLDMMQECRPPETVLMTSEAGIEFDIEVRQCRVKENFYGEFGDWEIRPVQERH